jgi:hypothetical protein
MGFIFASVPAYMGGYFRRLSKCLY